MTGFRIKPIHKKKTNIYRQVLSLQDKKMIPFKLKMLQFYHPYFKLKILVSEQANKEQNTHKRLSATTLQLSTVQGFLCLTRNEKCTLVYISTAVKQKL